MSDYPIIFSAQMIRALLDSRKSMTRRLAWRVNKKNGVIYETPWQRVKPGDILYVREQHWRLGRWKREYHQIGTRERWRFVPANNTTDSISFERPAAAYTRSMRVHDDLAWWKRQSIFHPLDLSRITLIVTATKIERLQDIGEEDSIAEGIDRVADNCGNGPAYCDYELTRQDDVAEWFASARNSFASLWRCLHSPASWDDNPEVCAISFRVARKNIDAIKADNDRVA